LIDKFFTRYCSQATWQLHTTEEGKEGKQASLDGKIERIVWALEFLLFQHDVKMALKAHISTVSKHPVKS
jgi:hypothetical protein